MKCSLGISSFLEEISSFSHSIVFLFFYFFSSFYIMIYTLIINEAAVQLLNSSLMQEKAMAPHSSTLAWKIPWIEEPCRLQSMGSLRVGHDWATSLSCIGDGNGNPLQCSCLENPRDRGAWWAAVYGVTQSWTRLKWLSSSSSSKHATTIQPRNCILGTYSREMKTYVHTKTCP